MAFIVFEGGEGSGKSTQIELLGEVLKLNKIKFVTTREPGGTPLAEDIRNLFKAIPQHHDEPTPLTELCLVMAARSQHIEKFIGPNLRGENWILCDRFLDSSFVYQGIRGGLDYAIIRGFAKPVVRNIVPDLVFVMQIPSEVGCKRIDARGGHKVDRLDICDVATHDAINNGFVKLVQDKVAWHDNIVPKRVLINANATIDTIAKEILFHLNNELGLKL